MLLGLTDSGAETMGKEFFKESCFNKMTSVAAAG